MSVHFLVPKEKGIKDYKGLDPTTMGDCDYFTVTDKEGLELKVIPTETSVGIVVELTK